MPIKEIIRRLKDAQIENYLFEAKIIEEHAKKYSLSKNDVDGVLSRRANREPLQYILGEWEFYGDVYKLNTACLIPRPETELLTEYIISNARRNGFILDLCSGSGCVSISALKRRKDLTAFLVDISEDAIEISKENAEINGIGDRIGFYCLDIIREHGKVLNAVKNINSGCDMIVSNPPYLTKSEVERIKSEKTEVYYEPEAALLGGADGLDFYRFIINNYSRVLERDTVTAFECGINQYNHITHMFEQAGFSCDIIYDYNKIQRIIIGRLK